MAGMVQMTPRYTVECGKEIARYESVYFKKLITGFFNNVKPYANIRRKDENNFK